MKAVDIMTSDVVMISESNNIADAIKKMEKTKVSSLIVESISADDTYGIVTRRDVVNKVIASGLDPASVNVAEIMTKPIMTVSPNLSLKHIANLMVRTGVRRVPVFDGHKILGIVSNSDILHGFARTVNGNGENFS
ncbi:MAG: CBS domain-containing protein [Candidatus Schekmanbacteria bacterium]|nr:CBS domain-containing protein [Candidatus Schekmanbacteria bacterium]